MSAFADMDKLDPAHLQSIGANGPMIAPVGDEEPTPLIHEIPDGDPFPIESMGPLKEATAAILDITQAPAAIGAQSLLAAASLACQGHADVQTLGGIRPISLYALTITAIIRTIVAPSASGSGETGRAIARILGKPGVRVEKRLDETIDEFKARVDAVAAEV